MPTVKCPGCRNKGETGPMFGPEDTSGPDIAVKPGNIEGTTKSLLHCRDCGTTFLKGPVGRGRPVEGQVWNDMVAAMTPELPAGMTVYPDR